MSEVKVGQKWLHGHSGALYTVTEVANGLFSYDCDNGLGVGHVKRDLCDIPVAWLDGLRFKLVSDAPAPQVAAVEPIRVGDRFGLVADKRITACVIGERNDGFDIQWEDDQHEAWVSRANLTNRENWKRLASIDAFATVDIGPKWGKSIAEKLVDAMQADSEALRSAKPTAREAKAAEAKYEAPKPVCVTCKSGGDWPERVVRYVGANLVGLPSKVTMCDPCYVEQERRIAGRTDVEQFQVTIPKPPAMGPLPVRFEVGGWNRKVRK